MLDLQRAWKGTQSKAVPLPDAWRSLAAKQIKFRRGQVCMVAAQPNAGKSMFALIYAIKTKVPTLFFSADTDTTTVAIRAAALADAADGAEGADAGAEGVIDDAGLSDATPRNDCDVDIIKVARS